MDFSAAIPLLAGIWLFVEFVKQAYKAAKATELPSWVAIVLAVVGGQLLTPLMAHSAWGHEQVVGKVALDTMNGSSLAIAGFFAAGVIALGHWVGSNVISSIGQNQPPDPQ